MSKKKPRVESAGNPLTLILTAILGPLTKGNLIGWLVLIVVILGLRWIWFEPYKIPSGSMEPTLNGDARFLRGDRVFINKHIYGIRIPFTKQYVWEWHDPQRWEIVVFKAAHENPEHNTLIKRVVGLPGERIHIENGAVFVNGEKVEPPDDLKEVLYYTTELMAPRAQLKQVMVDITKLPSPPPQFVHWDDIARRVFLEVALTNRYPFQLNMENENVKKFVQDVGEARKKLEAEGVSTMEGALASGVADTIDPGSAQLAKELLIHAERGKLKLPADNRSPLYSQPAVVEAEETLAALKDKLTGLSQAEVEQGALEPFFEGVSHRTWRLISDWLVSVTDSPRTELRYGVRTEDEYSVIPEGHYLLLGDNSGNSLDGRVTGWVPRGHIIGRAFCIWWPVGHWRDFTGFSRTWWGAGLLYGLPALFAAYTFFYLIGLRIVTAHQALADAGVRRGSLVLLDLRAFRPRMPFLPGRRLPARTGDIVLFVVDGDERVGRVVALAGEALERDGKAAKPVPADRCAVAELNGSADGSAPHLVGADGLVAAVYPMMRSRAVAQRA